MKLFYKFLATLLVISLIPLAMFTAIMLKTTGTALKNAINQNYTNFFYPIISKEINDFFLELTPKLELAQKIVNTPGITKEQIYGMMGKEMLNSSVFMGLFLLDSDKNFVVGFGVEELNIDKELLLRVDQYDQNLNGSIRKTSDNRPYFDMVYPINKKGVRQYFCYRVKLSYLSARINSFLNKKKSTNQNIFIVDKLGGVFFTNPDTPVDYDTAKKYLSNQQYDTVEENGNINIVLARGDRWTVVFQEPSKYAYNAITGMKISSMILIFITFCLAVFSAIALAKNLTRPIEKLIKGVEIVSEGNLDYQVPKVSNDELSRLVDVFNSMLVKLKKLQEDMKKSERLSAVGQMANILGHEIRNPIGAISNAAYFMKMQMTRLNAIDPKIFKHLGIIEVEIRSTNKIINDMLDFSRTRPPVLSETDFNELLNTIISDIKIPENIKLESDLTEIPKIFIDFEEIKQVIRNLINNAVDSMKDKPESALKIHTYKTVMPKTNQVAAGLDISDTGCGIPKENLEKIFEPFFSTKSKGTGLGLAVVKRIIQERHYGSIEIKSVVGEGTAFKITLPVKTDKGKEK